MSCVYAPASWNGVVRGGKTFLFSLTSSWFLTSDLNEISLHFFPHSFSHSMLLVGFCCVVLGVVMVFLFMRASGSALIPLKCEAWIPSEAPFSGLNNLWFSSHFAAPVSLCMSEAGGTGRAAVLSHHAKKWMGKDAFHITSVHFKLNGPRGLSRCSAFEALKRYLGAVWEEWVVWFFFFQFLPSDTNTKLFHLQRNKLDVPGWRLFILSNDESESAEFPQLGLLLLCIGLKTLTSAVRLIYSTKGVKSVSSCLNSVLKE